MEVFYGLVLFLFLWVLFWFWFLNKDIMLKKLRCKTHSSSSCLISQFLGSDFSEFLDLHKIHKAEFPADFKSRSDRQADQQTEHLVLSPHIKATFAWPSFCPNHELIYSLLAQLLSVTFTIYLKAHRQYIFYLKTKKYVSK